MSTSAGSGRFSAELMHAAAVLYFVQDATQTEVAARLKVSQATVSRLLSEARRAGIVHISVPPLSGAAEDDLGEQLAAKLSLQRAHVFATTSPEVLTDGMGPALGKALTDASLRRGDVLLISSGKMCHAAAHCDLPVSPGVLVAPTVGGSAEPMPWYQTNEITRGFAERLGGRPTFLYAPALPSAALREGLLEDPGTAQVISMWERASCAVLGIGAPPSTLRSLPHYLSDRVSHLERAVGDVCSRFYDADGSEVSFPGSENLLATSLEALRAIPTSIAVAIGAEKALSITAAARAGLFNRLVTDAATAQVLVDQRD